MKNESESENENENESENKNESHAFFHIHYSRETLGASGEFSNFISNKCTLKFGDSLYCV